MSPAVQMWTCQQNEERQKPPKQSEIKHAAKHGDEKDMYDVRDALFRISVSYMTETGPAAGSYKWILVTKNMSLLDKEYV